MKSIMRDHNDCGGSSDDIVRNMEKLFYVWVISVGLLLGFTGQSIAQIRTRTQPPYPTAANSVSWIANVPYVSGGGPEQQLDLYVPTNLKGEALVVYVHGGGWQHGDKAGDSLNPNNLQWLWQGYAMASINYRLVQTALWPAQIEDCKAAIRWLRAHAADYGYDPARIGVVGESAGGHLVAMLGTTSGKHVYDVGENLNYSSDVTSVVDLFGVNDLTQSPADAATLLGQKDKDNQESMRAASPVTYVHQGEPPMLIVQGTDDKLVSYKQAEILADAMDKVHAVYHFHTVVGAGHNPYFGLNINSATGRFDTGGGGIGIFEDREVEPMIIAFLHSSLAKQPSTK
jgi:acetyl esterase/lipase